MTGRNFQVLDATLQESGTNHLPIKLAEICPERYMKKMLEIVDFGFDYTFQEGLDGTFIEALKAGKWQTSVLGITPSPNSGDCADKDCLSYAETTELR